MKFKTCFNIAVLFLPLFAHSLNFRVIEINGDPVSYNEKSKKWVKLAEQDSISDKSKVRIGQSDYLLLNSEEGILEFNLKGTYNLPDYVGKVIELDQLASSWESLALDSLKANTPQRKTLYNKNLLDAKTDDDLLSVYPSPTVTYDSEIELKWRPMDENIYIVEIFYSKESIYFYREVSGDRIKINLFELNLPSDRCLYWTVRVKGSKYRSKPKCIYLLNIGETSNIEVPRFQIEDQLNLERSAIHNLIMALFYEQNKIMHRAEKHYEMAWALAHNSDRFKQIYYNFLDRRNQKEIE